MHTDSPMNFLIMGASDARHVIKTVARAWRHGSRPMRVTIAKEDSCTQFYIMEPQSSTLARQMMLLNVLWNPDLEMGLQGACTREIQMDRKGTFVS